MLLAIGAVVLGLILLVWSADRFVDGAAATAGHLGLPSLLIGILVIGFGTSAPEMMVSALAAWQGIRVNCDGAVTTLKNPTSECASATGGQE